MDVIFEDDALREMYEKGTTKDSRYKRLCKDAEFVKAYKIDTTHYGNKK